MCQGCWEDNGKPRIDNEKVRQLAAMRPSVETYGNLHIIVDDWNVEDEHIASCQKDVEASAKGYNCNEWAFLDLASTMTVAERLSALALNEGCWK